MTFSPLQKHFDATEEKKESLRLVPDVSTTEVRFSCKKAAKGNGKQVVSVQF